MDVGAEDGAERLWVTSGDAAGGVMRQAGYGGTILAWQDVLHEGPLPGGLPLEAFTAVRAAYIRERGWAGPAGARDVAAELAARDRTLLDPRFGHVALWFEHDLFDQLQLVQVLAALDARRPETPASILFVDSYLGPLTPAAMAPLRAAAVPVTTAMRALASQAWRALTTPDAGALASFVARDTSALPYLGAALRRLLEERPGPGGLARSRRQILAAVAPCQGDLARMFVACGDMEEAVYLGDIVFMDYVRELADGPEPLLTLGADASPWRRKAALTARGAALLAAGPDLGRN